MAVKKKGSKKAAKRKAARRAAGRKKKKRKIMAKKAERIRTTRGMRMGPPNDFEHGRVDESFDRGPKENVGGSGTMD